MVAQALLESFCIRMGAEVPAIMATAEGTKLEGALLHHPFYNKQLPVLLGDHVTTEAGTGCVHTAP